jgi:hypothetical protein
MISPPLLQVVFRISGLMGKGKIEICQYREERSNPTSFHVFSSTCVLLYPIWPRDASFSAKERTNVSINPFCLTAFPSIGIMEKLLKGKDGKKQ